MHTNTLYEPQAANQFSAEREHSVSSKLPRLVLVLLLLGLGLLLAEQPSQQLLCTVEPLQPLLHCEAASVEVASSKPEQAKLPVLTSVAPLANRISLSQIDSLALDRKLVRTQQDQQSLVKYFASKYRIQTQAVRNFVHTTMIAAAETRLDPLLLLAVMSIESNFNPEAKSTAGAQGLMQVMPNVHADKFNHFGGIEFATVPEVNIRVGALVLKQAIASMGSLRDGLRMYVGAAASNYTDGGYVEKVLQEFAKIVQLMGGEVTDNLQGASTNPAISPRLPEQQQPDLNNVEVVVNETTLLDH